MKAAQNRWHATYIWGMNTPTTCSPTSAVKSGCRTHCNGPRELFDRLERLIAACGQYEVAPAKTRIAFMARVRFSGVNAISDRGMTIAFALPRPLRHRRIRKVENIAPGWHGHWMRVTSPDELDDELLGWLRESFHQMGLQERLAR